MADAFKPALLVVLAAVPLGLIYGLQRDWKQVVSVIVLVALFGSQFWRIIRLTQLRAKSLQTIERIYAISESGLRCSVSFDGAAPELLGKIPWKDIAEIQDEGDALILRARAGDTHRLPYDAFPDPSQHVEVVSQWQAAHRTR